MKTIAIASTVLLLVACGGEDDMAGDATADAGEDTVTDSGDPWIVGDAPMDRDDLCDDEENAGRWEACRSAEDVDTCIAHGGSWNLVHEFCYCETFEGACACAASGDCLADCLAPTVSGPLDCTGVTGGTCSAGSVTFGCHCYFEEDGSVYAMCVDPIR